MIRYIIITLVLITFIGCKSNSNSNEDNKDIVKETTPSNIIGKDKTPPAVPEI